MIATNEGLRSYGAYPQEFNFNPNRGFYTINKKIRHNHEWLIAFSLAIPALFLYQSYYLPRST